MLQPHKCDDAGLYAAFEADRSVRGARDRQLLRLIREFDKRRLWERDGCMHMGQWLALEYGITVSEGVRLRVPAELECGSQPGRGRDETAA